MAACYLDARNVPGLPGIPPIEHDKTWVIVEELCVKVIDEVRGAEDAHNHYHTDDGTSDFMSTAAASLTTPLHLTSVEIARREIQVWKSRTIPLPKTSNPLKEWRRGVKIFPWLSLLARCVLAIPDTSASPERLFFLPLVTPRPRNVAVCHVIILRNACIYTRTGLKSASGPQIGRSSTWITSSS